MFTDCDQTLQERPFDLEQLVLKAIFQIFIHKCFNDFFAEEALLAKGLQQHERPNFGVVEHS